MEKRISFLFGAGAEVDYDVPQGDAFARATLFKNNRKLFEALADFYKGIETCCALDDWISNYRGNTAFSNEMGRQIIIYTVSSCLRMNPSAFNSHEDSLKWVIEAFFSRGNYQDLSDEPILWRFKQNGWIPSFRESNEDREELKEVLTWIESPDSIPASHKHAALGNLIAKEMKSYGVLEKYFYTVINPKKYGPYKYWKLVNYYWQAYFSIMVPICEYLTRNGSQFFEQLGIGFDGCSKMIDTKQNYLLLLEHIESVSKALWSDHSLGIYRSNMEQHYYQHKTVMDAVGIISTNYTPIIKSIHPQKLAQINGSLNLFEYPFELAVYDFCKDSRHPEHKMFFPFIFGTSSLKPVVHSIQIHALKTLKEILDESDTLVIIGYALNEDDNHLNSFIREFLLDYPDRESHRVIYCHYDKGESIDESRIKKRILAFLRINQRGGQLECEFDRLKILHNRGDAKEIFSRISEYLECEW